MPAGGWWVSNLIAMRFIAVISNCQLKDLRCFHRDGLLAHTHNNKNTTSIQTYKSITHRQQLQKYKHGKINDTIKIKLSNLLLYIDQLIIETVHMAILLDKIYPSVETCNLIGHNQGAIT